MPRVSIISEERDRRAAVVVPAPAPVVPVPTPSDEKLCWCKRLDSTLPLYDWHAQLQDGRPRCQAMLRPDCNQCDEPSFDPNGVVCEKHIDMRFYGTERLARDHQRLGYMGFLKRVITCECSIVIGSDGHVRL